MLPAKYQANGPVGSGVEDPTHSRLVYDPTVPDFSYFI